ncbi:MAG: 50S ribosomal protein L17 [Deltaproteobacteria bacterium]|nr:MAG: 50S ribosomal protein L17 [Deltaproteobacteria bacterium]
MRHRKDGRQFGRNTSHRRAMFRNLAANLINHERIVTTDAKAKELRRVTDKLITKAKRLGAVAYTPQPELSQKDKNSRLHVSRLIASYLPRWGVERDGETKRDLVEKVMVDLSKRMAERPGGYTRIIKLGPRRGDGANMSVIELVDAPPPTADDEAELETQAAEETSDSTDEAADAKEEAEAAPEDEDKAEADDK